MLSANARISFLCRFSVASARAHIETLDVMCLYVCVFCCGMWISVLPLPSTKVLSAHVALWGDITKAWRTSWVQDIRTRVGIKVDRTPGPNHHLRQTTKRQHMHNTLKIGMKITQSTHKRDRSCVVRSQLPQYRAAVTRCGWQRGGYCCCWGPLYMHAHRCGLWWKSQFTTYDRMNGNANFVGGLVSECVRELREWAEAITWARTARHIPYSCRAHPRTLRPTNEPPPRLLAHFAVRSGTAMLFCRDPTTIIAHKCTIECFFVVCLCLHPSTSSSAACDDDAFAYPSLQQQQQRRRAPVCC